MSPHGTACLTSIVTLQHFQTHATQRQRRGIGLVSALPGSSLLFETHACVCMINLSHQTAFGVHKTQSSCKISFGNANITRTTRLFTGRQRALPVPYPQHVKAAAFSGTDTGIAAEKVSVTQRSVHSRQPTAKQEQQATDEHHKQVSKSAQFASQHNQY